jgi:hypothetical protein
LFPVVFQAAIVDEAAIFGVTMKGNWNEIAVAVEINAELAIVDCDTRMSIKGFALI